jgi:hypothetical protein
LTPDEQLDELRKEIKELAINRVKIPELIELTKVSDLAVLNICKGTLENGDPKFIEVLRDNTEAFMDIVQHELCGQNMLGMKWDDFILRFEWNIRLRDWIKLDTKFGENMKNFIIRMSRIHFCKFDEKTILNNDSQGAFNDKSFSKLIEEDNFKERYAPIRT